MTYRSGINRISKVIKFNVIQNDFLFTYFQKMVRDTQTVVKN